MISLRRQKRSDLVVDEIKRWIAEEGRTPGERLPQERDLIKLFGVSKSTIRESLKSLEVQGLVQINTGPAGGPVIAEVPYEVTAELLGNYFFFQDLSAERIYQLRKLVEPELTAAAVPHLTPEQLDRLDRSIACCSEEPDGPEARRRQRLEELAFHDILAEACPNPLLSFACHFVNHLLGNLVVFKKMYLPLHEEIRTTNVGHHTRILAAIRKRDAAGARRLMARHMVDCERHVIELEAVVENNFLKRGRRGERE